MSEDPTEVDEERNAGDIKVDPASVEDRTDPDSTDTSAALVVVFRQEQFESLHAAGWNIKFCSICGMIVDFQYLHQVVAGLTLRAPISLPQSTGPHQLQQIVNKFLNNEEKMPYAFYILYQELVVQLWAYLEKNKVVNEYNEGRTDAHATF